MPTYKSQMENAANIMSWKLQTWRTEAFENTITFSEFESYFVAHLDTMILKSLQAAVGKSTSSGATQQHCVAKYKTVVLATDHLLWWRLQKLGAIKEARRQQQEE